LEFTKILFMTYLFCNTLFFNQPVLSNLGFFGWRWQALLRSDPDLGLHSRRPWPKVQSGRVPSNSASLRSWVIPSVHRFSQGTSFYMQILFALKFSISNCAMAALHLLKQYLHYNKQICISYNKKFLDVLEPRVEKKMLCRALHLSC